MSESLLSLDLLMIRELEHVERPLSFFLKGEEVKKVIEELKILSNGGLKFVCFLLNLCTRHWSRDSSSFPRKSIWKSGGHQKSVSLLLCMESNLRSLADCK